MNFFFDKESLSSYNIIITKCWQPCWDNLLRVAWFLFLVDVTMYRPALGNYWAIHWLCIYRASFILDFLSYLVLMRQNQKGSQTLQHLLFLCHSHQRSIGKYRALQQISNSFNYLYVLVVPSGQLSSTLSYITSK